jgi:hypothetical protein
MDYSERLPFDFMCELIDYDICLNWSIHVLKCSNWSQIPCPSDFCQNGNTSSYAIKVFAKTKKLISLTNALHVVPYVVFVHFPCHSRSSSSF